MWRPISSTMTVFRRLLIGRDSRYGMRTDEVGCPAADVKPSARHPGRSRGRKRRACLTMGLVFAAAASTAAAQHRHPPQDEALHEKLYSTWYMPDNPAASCCNDADCYPTEIKHVGGNLHARRREDGQYILIPPQKEERNRDNPDGSNHVCAPPPNSYHSADTVFCFSLGGGT
jgi:hypothetical protein